MFTHCPKDITEWEFVAGYMDGFSTWEHRTAKKVFDPKKELLTCIFTQDEMDYIFSIAVSGKDTWKNARENGIQSMVEELYRKGYLREMGRFIFLSGSGKIAYRKLVELMEVMD